MAKKTTKPSTKRGAKKPISPTVASVLAWLERRGSARNRSGMAHFGIRAPKIYGVSMATMRPLMKKLGRNHDLAIALWQTGWYEARILAASIADPRLTTSAQMDAWCAEFDNWAVCDSACFHLFDRTPHAAKKIKAWSNKKAEFVRRAAFAIMAGLAVHNKQMPNAVFLNFLPLIERASGDDRNFVKKAVNWALRQIGKRNLELLTPATTMARKLAASSEPSARWIGKDAVRELTSPEVIKRLQARAKRVS